MQNSKHKNRIVEYCQQNQLSLTPLREHVLDIILTEKGVIKAYQVLAKMQGKSQTIVAPPTVYRTLDFWADAGVLHKIDAINGYIVCRHRHEHEKSTSTPFILVCRTCGAVFEYGLPDLWEQLHHALQQKHFIPDTDHVVLTGICQKCQ